MEHLDKKDHWEKIFSTRKLTDVSWYEPTPKVSLEFLKEYNIPVNAKIIDIGGGDSLFVDHLLDLGYSNVTVLDISNEALKRAKVRLGPKSSQVKWIVTDVSDFIPTEKYDFWHDRAAFHFLTDDFDISKYITNLSNGLSEHGLAVIGTFSEKGPNKCSGIEIKQYSEITLPQKLAGHFKKVKCFTMDHYTPSQNVQNFIFCAFRRNEKC